jgi:hypothetical protein
MNNEECFAIWAPDGNVWSQWAKPVTFTQIARSAHFEREPVQWECAIELRNVPSAGRVALVVDVPGEDAVRLGVGLARIGYRPVPLFNATSGYSELLDIDPIAHRLHRGAELLQKQGLPRDAPPAFLLDSNRMHPPSLPQPGKFDNRWVTLPQDFPSGTFLQSRGIVEVLLLRLGAGGPDLDLRHVLRRWQEAGLRLSILDLSGAGNAQPLHVDRPSFFKLAWYRVLALSGLRRADVGGFGSAIPEQSAGSGGGGFG